MGINSLGGISLCHAPLGIGPEARRPEIIFEDRESYTEACDIEPKGAATLVDCRGDEEGQRADEKNPQVRNCSIFE
jgi:hypothetical protein